MLNSGDRHAAVDDDHLAGDVVGGISGEEQRDAFELTGFADPWNRAERLDAGLGEWNRGVGEPRVEKARRDRVYADALASPRRRQFARESQQAGLARGVPNVVRA